MEKINSIVIKDSNDKAVGSHVFSEEFEMYDEVFTEAGYEFRYVDGVKGMRVMEFNQPSDTEYGLMDIIKLVYISKDLREGKDIRYKHDE